MNAERDLTADVDDQNQAIMLVAELMERLISSSTKFQRDERMMMLRKVDEIRSLATPQTRDE